jgi:hypothetical protein
MKSILNEPHPGRSLNSAGIAASHRRWHLPSDRRKSLPQQRRCHACLQLLFRSGRAFNSSYIFWRLTSAECQEVVVKRDRCAKTLSQVFASLNQSLLDTTGNIGRAGAYDVQSRQRFHAINSENLASSTIMAHCKYLVRFSNVVLHD